MVKVLTQERLVVPTVLNSCLQEQASNRPVLLRSKGVVVSDRGKGIGRTLSGKY